MINPSTSFTEIKYEPPKTIAGKFVSQIQEVEEGIRKIVVDPSMLENMSQQGVSPDLTDLMSQMMGAVQSNSNIDNKSFGMHTEAAALMQQMLQNKVEENPDAGLDVIRKRPEYLEKAMKEASSRDRFLLDIANSSVLDLVINKSNKQDTINTLQTLSKVDYTKNIQEPIFYFTDIGLTFYFDENDILTEIEVDEKYRRSTTLGLKVNDTIDKAIELYGAPRMKSAKGAIWNNFSIIMRDRSNEIMFIRLKIRT